MVGMITSDHGPELRSDFLGYSYFFVFSSFFVIFFPFIGQRTLNIFVAAPLCIAKKSSLQTNVSIDNARKKVRY